ncbi:hypothetical protein BZG36_02736 [Bifiguratus adelaidae]|uniref:Calcineurin-like phosphoesterase domain-containing protein n=1 Tax=Bifiguratus adelaidae TaxID=1938954 RepID=A0A261XYN4_9FUNG|nr:hypothetical protein BZG36_02736 [Bifiguratus adelaidae]
MKVQQVVAVAWLIAGFRSLATAVAVSGEHQQVFGRPQPDAFTDTATSVDNSTWLHPLAQELIDQSSNLSELIFSNYDASDVETGLSCGQCVNLLRIVKDLSWISTGLAVNSLILACNRANVVDGDVCKGFFQEQGPIIAHVAKASLSVDPGGYSGHLVCASVAGACAYPTPPPFTVGFPKEKPTKIVPSTPSGETFTVLHLSDWHYDPNYQEGAEANCSRPLCCQRRDTDPLKGTIPQNISRPANKWGDYNCDAPFALLESALDAIPKLEPDIAFAMLTGDIPPHNVWSTTKDNVTYQTETFAFEHLHSHFDKTINITVYPVVGNHEAAPTNIFPLNTSIIPDNKLQEWSTQWLYNTLADDWEGWLSSDMLESVRHNSGSYVSQPRDNLLLITLNTNFCYQFNWWLFQNTSQVDPNGMLSWLIGHLQYAEDNGMKVWIQGHIAPGDSNCLHGYSNYYYQIVGRYAPHVIVSQFFGHTHRDEFEVFYEDGIQDASHANAVAFLGPSVTTFLNLNPGLRFYTVDAKTFEIMDTKTYIADMNKVDEWQEEGPNWHLEYSARQAYLPEKHYPKHLPLTPAWWHNVTVLFEQSNRTFDKYMLHRAKSAPTPGGRWHAPGEPDDKDPDNGDDDEDELIIPWTRNHTADEEAYMHLKRQIICQIRAGNSEMRCDYKREDPYKQISATSLAIGREAEKRFCGLGSLFDRR